MPSPRSPRAPQAPLAAAAATVAIGVVVLTGLAAVRTGEPRPWTVPAVGPAVLVQPLPLISDEEPELVSSDAAAQGPAPGAPRSAATWQTATAEATGIPAVAVRAYGDAVLALEVEAPGCRVGWTTLAGLGAVESGHGSHDGSVLLADGRASPGIVGPALDGNGVAAIRATPESTAWHGDPVWDHAVGPMQFIPSTWRRWGADGDGDGVADPQDIDDAALAAARYLCADGRDLSAAAGWQAAVFSYNHSDAYVADVLALADGYGAAVTRAAGQ
ncbi:lytic transglycosylase domain-containing protein [Cellulomonas sp. KRMCY2]|uniref:lytic transglycosylase domain-containing protein n=1 Tax=Cellulomonas sp. KRMCY2 TaxID=1304865 RepID=UPI00045EBA48|nr:lytic transglycosylase domain-containing protein [Cellulomonas sp. KRMCY2]